MSKAMRLIIGILKENLGLFFLCLLVFTVGIPAGYLAYEDIREPLNPILEKLRDMVSSKSKLDMALTIFLINLRVSAIIIVSGVFIVFPLFILFTNGLLMGFVIKLSEVRGVSPLFLIKGFLPHSLFELTAIFLSSTIGVRIGLSIIFPGDKTRVESMAQRIREASLIYILIILPLLIIAAFVEAYVTSSLIM